jgi:hypothetical protein
MKVSRLKQIIKEEITRALKESEFDQFLNSLNIKLTPSSKPSTGLDVGSHVAVIGKGPGEIVYVDDDKQKYTVLLSITGRTIEVPFQSVKPVQTLKVDKDLLSRIKELEKDHRNYKRIFVGDTNSFEGEVWKLGSIADFYLEMGKEMWEMFKQDYDYVTHSNEYENLFLDILRLLKRLQQEGENDNLDKVVTAYEMIGDRLGSGVA